MTSWEICCLQAKISHGDETRVIHLASQITYAELLDNVKQKFPSAWPFQIKYLDRSVSSPLFLLYSMSSMRPFPFAFPQLQLCN